MFRHLRARQLCPVLWMAALPVSAACGKDLPSATRQEIRAKDVVLVFASQPGPITVGKHFSLDVRLCSAAAAANTKLRLLKVDADMPVHRHGMNYLAAVRLQVRSQGAARYQAEGLMFHMPGVWRLTFDVDAGAAAPPMRLTHELLLE